MAVRVGPYQRIVGVYWPDKGPRYVRIKAGLWQALDVSAGGEPQIPIEPVQVGSYYASMRGSEVWGAYGQDHWWADPFVVNEDGDVVEGAENVQVMASVVASYGEEKIIRSYGFFEMPYDYSTLMYGYGGRDPENTGAPLYRGVRRNDGMWEQYPGTPAGPAGSWLNRFVTESLKLQRLKPEWAGSPNYYNYFAPDDWPYAVGTFLTCPIAQGSQKPFDIFDPLAGVTVLYKGQACSFFASSMTAVGAAAGPTNGYHNFQAVFKIPESAVS
ncbi:MAG: hypothetical protein ABFD96_25385 [Armatimonadia bacterium]